MRNYKLNTKLEVTWSDIEEDPTWQSVADAGKPPTSECRSVGYFLKRDNKWLYMSSTIPDKERSRMVIPLGVISKIKSL